MRERNVRRSYSQNSSRIRRLPAAQHYAMLSSRMAKYTGMGVLAVDYRQLTSTTASSRARQRP